MCSTQVGYQGLDLPTVKHDASNTMAIKEICQIGIGIWCLSQWIEYVQMVLGLIEKDKPVFTFLSIIISINNNHTRSILSVVLMSCYGNICWIYASVEWSGHWTCPQCMQ